MQDMNRAGPYLQVRPVSEVIGAGREDCLTPIDKPMNKYFVTLQFFQSQYFCIFASRSKLLLSQWVAMLRATL